MKKKTEQTYSIAQNILFLIKEIARYDKRLLVYAVVAGVSEMLLPLVNLGLTAVVLEGVAGNLKERRLIGLFLIFLVGTLLCTILSKTSNTNLETKGNGFRVFKMNELSLHLASVDYDLFDGSKGQEMINKAFETVSAPNKAFQHMFHVTAAVIRNTLGFLLYSYILAEIHWLFIVLVAISSIVNFIYSLYVNKKEDENKKVIAPINRKLRYLTEQTGDFKQAKDMRMYQMEDWFGSVFTSLTQQKYHHTETILRKRFGGNVIDGLFTMAISLTAYVFLITLIVNGQITVATFTVYFGAIATLSRWISGLLQNGVDLNKIGLEIDDYREFTEINSTRNHGKGIELPANAHTPYAIEFKNVSYRYPEAETDTIKEFNLTIKPGEKIALVGTNGAGKSTLIKLLTGLYQPTEGDILVAGHSVSAYNIEDYFELFSVVFQDYYDLPVTIEEMIIQGQEKDRERLKKVEQQSGMDNIVQSFPEGNQTKLIKRVNPDAVDLSGGQKQKMQLAKALYKNGPILVLDEPTAALDPIAESEIYQKYEELSRDKTSIFISHRLASTRFCDRIIFIEDGKIVEEGTHAQLMRYKGKYYEMFETQSYYYKNEVGEVQSEII